MQSRRLLIALFAALVISGGCTLLLGRAITRHSAPKTEWRHYVATTRPMAPGEILKPADLTTIEWAANQTLQGGFTSPAAVTGRALLYPVQAGQPIIDGDLASSDAGIGLTTRIPDGMRAVALKSDDVVGVAGFVYPGSYVDVLVTYRTDRSPEPLTATVLQDAKVLATDHQTQPTNDGKAETVNVVTLLLSPENAERVVLASTQGTIHFVLRNGGDRQQVTETPAQLSQFGGAPAQPAAGLPVRHAPLVAAAKPRQYEIDTVLGEKTVKADF